MKLFQIAILGTLMIGGCLSNSKMRPPDSGISTAAGIRFQQEELKAEIKGYTPQQQKTLKNFRHFQNVISSKFHRQKTLEQAVFAGQTDEQRQSLENIIRIQQILDKQREAREAQLRDYYAE